MKAGNSRAWRDEVLLLFAALSKLIGGAYRGCVGSIAAVHPVIILALLENTPPASPPLMSYFLWGKQLSCCVGRLLQTYDCQLLVY